MTIILDGKKFAKKITERLKEKIKTYEKKPKLAVMVVGNNPASLIYVGNKQKKAEEIGLASIVIPLPENVTEENILEQIYILNEDDDINGIMIQLPLPEHINKKRILEAVNPVKDADGFTAYNAGRLALGYDCYARPCTPKGIIKLLEEYNIDIEGKNVVIAGRSLIVGKPLSYMFEQKNATVTLIHSKTKNPGEIMRNADILVSATGKVNFVTADKVKKDAVVIDVGINRTEKGITGDVDYENVAPLASYITPVPGGIGPITVAMLMENTFELYELQRSFRQHG